MNAPAPAATPDIQQLDALTGGAFSAPTSGERTQRVRQWLTTQPAVAQVQAVYKALNAKDKGAAKPLREHLDELRRSKEQEAVAAEWAQRAQTLLAAVRLNIADAMAWQRDAARAGAPLSREPLAQLKTQLAERVKGIEDLQHRVQVQREAAVLLAQRIETLSTKPWREADAVCDTLAQDVAAWQAQADALLAEPHSPSVDIRLPAQLDTSRGQLALVWEAFEAALAQARLAAADATAALPQVPVWADELRHARGLPPETAAPAKPSVDPQVREQAQAAVQTALTRLEKEIGEGHGKASTEAAAALRQALKEHGRHIDATLDGRAHAALAAAGELEGWQRWRADQLREELVGKAEGLLNRPAGQALGGRKMQETLRELRAQWKQTDQGGVPNHALWKRFDHACNEAHKVVDAWLEKARAEAAEVKARRLALIDELQSHTQPDASTEGRSAQAWRELGRTLHQLEERWRTAGHLGEKAFAEMDTRWKAALQAAWAPLKAAQAESVQRRQALIGQARVLGEEPVLRIDAVKDLQQRWQAEAQAMPLDRRQEQKLWDAFRQPIDAAFQRKSSQREKAQQATSARDRRVLDAAQALRDANASGDARLIRDAMQQLQAALREPEPAQAPVPAADVPVTETVAATTPDVSAERAAPEESLAAGSVPPPAPVRKLVVAVRGDDRPGKQAVGDARGKPALASGARQDSGRGKLAGRPERGRPDQMGLDRARSERGRADRAPSERLGDAAFRAQRDALDQAQLALKKLTAQAHGEAITHLLQAWEKRDAAALPSAQELGPKVAPAVRTAWGKALQGGNGDGSRADQTLLRLEMAANLPSPATALEARRAMQLQLLTQRHQPTPAQTWGEDVAAVLSSVYDPARGRRLQQVLRGLLQR